MSGVVMKIVGMVAGIETPHDGRYVVEYDPMRGGQEAGVRFFHLVTDEDLQKAKVYEDLAALKQDWARSIGTRGDGKPDRPLTAFSIEIENAPEVSP